MSASRAAVALVAATSAQWAVSAPVIPFPYPQLYKQCDLAWGNDLIGQELDVTICDVGCLMSSTSMALVHNNITIPSLSGNQNYSMTANPQSLNSWLQVNGGYVDKDDFDEADLPLLSPSHVGWNDTYGMHRTNDIPIEGVQALLNANQPVIANVMKGAHFVLVIGWDSADSDVLYVNDPGFSTTNYSYSQDVVGWRLFNMTPVV